jgi:P27 family predicted phage terminase small subunit
MLKPHRKLNASGERLWQQVMAEVLLEDAASVEVLLLACELLDTAVACKAVLRADGVMVETATGTKRESTLIRNQVQCSTQVARLLSQLGLDTEAPKANGRPPLSDSISAKFGLVG